MVALALPWPRVSRPDASSTALWSTSSFSMKVALPLYWAVMGPTLTFTMPAVLVALDLLELGAREAGSDALDVGEHGPGVLDGDAHVEVVAQLHRSSSSWVSMSAALPEARYLADEVGPPGHEADGPRGRRWSGRSSHIDPIEPDRVAPPALVGRHDDRFRRRGGRHRPPRLRPDEGLVAEAHHHGVEATHVGGVHGGGQRGGLALGPVGVVEQEGAGRQGRGQVDGAADHEHDVEGGGVEGRLDRPRHQRAAPEGAICLGSSPKRVEPPAASTAAASRRGASDIGPVNHP